MRSYAIGDIHGHLDKLRIAHDLIAADRAASGDDGAQLIHVGDLVDRGPDSRGVVEYLMSGIEAHEPWIVIKGNHDRMFAGFMSDPDHADPMLRPDLIWLDPRLGGADTLSSYGISDVHSRSVDELHAEALEQVPDQHAHFLSTLPIYHLRGEVLFVHAGIRPGIDLRDQTEDDLVWIRDGFLEDTRDHGVLIVHGHTAIDAATHYGNRVNIDSSVAYGGELSAIVIEGRSVWRLTPEGRVPLLPD